MVMQIFKRHITSTVFLFLYALWWVHFFYWFAYDAAKYPNSCGAANGGLIVLSLLVVAGYSLTTFILTLASKGQKRVDYLIFFVLVLLPILYVIGYLLINSY